MEHFCQWHQGDRGCGLLEGLSYSPTGMGEGKSSGAVDWRTEWLNLSSSWNSLSQLAGVTLTQAGGGLILN